MKLFKNWLIRQLGGYTYNEMHIVTTRAIRRELWVQWTMANIDMSKDQVVSATNYVMARADAEVEMFMTGAFGYRGNKEK